MAVTLSDPARRPAGLSAAGDAPAHVSPRTGTQETASDAAQGGAGKAQKAESKCNGRTWKALAIVAGVVAGLALVALIIGIAAMVFPGFAALIPAIAPVLAFIVAKALIITIASAAVLAVAGAALGLSIAGHKGKICTKGKEEVDEADKPENTEGDQEVTSDDENPEIEGDSTGGRGGIHTDRNEGDVEKED